jgi:hypothetical protein
MKLGRRLLILFVMTVSVTSIATVAAACCGVDY